VSTHLPLKNHALSECPVPGHQAKQNVEAHEIQLACHSVAALGAKPPAGAVPPDLYAGVTTALEKVRITRHYLTDDHLRFWSNPPPPITPQSSLGTVPREAL